MATSGENKATDSSSNANNPLGLGLGGTSYEDDNQGSGSGSSDGTVDITEDQKAVWRKEAKWIEVKTSFVATMKFIIPTFLTILLTLFGYYLLQIIKPLGVLEGKVTSFESTVEYLKQEITTNRNDIKTLNGVPSYSHQLQD
jgi:hypothetical protein